MPEPIVFISHFRVKPGGLAPLRALFAETSQSIETDKPNTPVYLGFLDDGGERLTVVHVFGDGASMDAHFVGADARSAAASELMSPDGWEIYGSPSPEALAMLRQAADASGVGLTVDPSFVAGFVRC